MEQTDGMPLAQPQAASGKGLSFRGLVEVFTGPAAFFVKLKEHPKILVPMITYAIMLLLFSGIALDVLYEFQMNLPEMQERLQGQELPPMAQQIQRYSILFGAPVAMVLMALVAALLALFWGNVVYGGEARFKQIFSVVLYGELIYGLGALVVLPLVLIKETPMVGLNLGALVTNLGPSSILYLALSKIDLFIIWEIIVIGIGLSILYNVPRNKGYVISVLSVGMLSVLHVVFTAVAKLFM